MINFSKNQTVNAEEICLRGEQSRSAKTKVAAHRASNGTGAEIIHRTQVKSPDRAQLKAAQRIEVSLRYMMQHLNQPMQVPALSAMVGLSDSTFYAFFKRATGRTPLDFFIRLRMHRAGEILEETTLLIKEVAAMLDYEDQFYFSHVFKSVHGIAPREYRLRSLESKDRNLKLKSSNERNPRCLHPYLPRLVQTSEDEISKNLLTGGFQPAAKRTNVFQGSCGESLSKPNQTCSVPIHP